MMRWIIFSLLFFSVPVFCQPLIEGTIVDKDTGKPVPFASVNIVGTSKGTSSNLDGKFTISVAEPFVLKVSCLGYSSVQVNSIAEASVIQMESVATQLGPLVITDKAIQPKKILRKAFASIGVNYSSEPFLQQFFYRHYCKDDDVYGRLLEAYVDVWKNQGYRSTQSRAGEKEEIRVTHLRRSLDKTEVAQGHEPLSVDDVMQGDLVGYQAPSRSEHLSFYAEVSNLKADFDQYTFTSNGITYYDNQEVYEIAYSYKQDSALTTSGKYVRRPHVTGTLYITTDTYAFVKAEDVKTDGRNVIKTSVYYRKYNDVYYPYHLVRNGESYAVNSVHQFHVELMSVEIKNDVAEKFTGRLPSRKELLDIPYDSAFWSTHTVLKTTPLEEEIISDLGGGESLNKQFLRYRQYEMNVHDGGQDGEKKFTWLKEDSKGSRILYLFFWSGNYQTYIAELEWAKRLQQQYKNKISFVLISLDEDEQQWQQTVEKYTLYADGIINYRIGSDARILKSLKVKSAPSFILLDRDGQPFQSAAKHPNDPLLVQDLNFLISQR